jgi:hypothetical protein
MKLTPARNQQIPVTAIAPRSVNGAAPAAGSTAALPGPAAITGAGTRPAHSRPAWRGFAVLASLAAPALIAACNSSAPATSSPPAAAPSTPPVAATSPASAPAGKPTSCSVVTAAEASAALGGQKVTGPHIGRATVEGGTACVWYGPHVPPGASPNIPYGDTVRVVLVVGPKAKNYFDDYRSKVHAQTIAGLGDAAFYDGYASISVLKGDAYLRIAVGIINPLGPEKTLAAEAAPRM